MYYLPNPYPYYAKNTPLYYPDYDYMSRSSHGNDHQVIEDIIRSIKREAATIDLYKRLARIAPNQEYKNSILHALEGKQAHVTQFTNLYSNLTGSQPSYQLNKIAFDSFRDGLQKAYMVEVASYEDHEKISSYTQHPQIRSVFLWALNGERENAARLSSLHNDIFHQITDYGPNPFVINIDEATKENNTFRTALWTGEHLQVTLMSIDVGEDIGLEIHPTLDQFLRIEDGEGVVQMGDSKDILDFQENVYDDFAIVIPAGKWHNLTNTGDKPLKLYSIYAPPQHPYGTVHKTKEIAMAAEEDHHH